jgi:hypothetical protein
MFCEYKNFFGKVDTGVHSYRIANIAIVDVILTIIFAFVVHLLFNNYSFCFILIVLFLSSIVMHRLFCVRTTVDKFLFVN